MTHPAGEHQSATPLEVIQGEASTEELQRRHDAIHHISPAQREAHDLMRDAMRWRAFVKSARIVADEDGGALLFAYVSTEYGDDALFTEAEKDLLGNGAITDAASITRIWDDASLANGPGVRDAQ